MSGPPIVEVCGRCDYRAYPPRLLCPRCGGADWREISAETGLVTELTELRSGFEPRQLPSGAWLEQESEPPRIASVDADAGVRIVVRAAGDVGVGDRVRLVAEPGKVVAVSIRQESND